MLVFIIAADESSAATLQEFAEEDGYAVIRTARGGNALAEIAASAPNLVLLDTQLPDADPFRLLEDLKQSRPTRGIPVILMTTLDDVETSSRDSSRATT